MRTGTLVSLAILFVFGVAPKQAGAKDDPAQSDSSAAIDEMALQVFNEADHNHNHVLNKTEFRNAYTMLETQVEEWGRSGVIGKPKKHPNKDKDKDGRAAASVLASADKLAKSNKVSQAEFTFFVHAFVGEADENWREMHAMTAAQLKAFQAQRRAMGPYRGRQRYAVPNMVPSVLPD